MSTIRMGSISSVCASILECRIRTYFVSSVIKHVSINVPCITADKLTERIIAGLRERITDVVTTLLHCSTDSPVETLSMLTGIPVLVDVENDNAAEYCEILLNIIVDNINSGLIYLEADGGFKFIHTGFFRNYKLRMRTYGEEATANLHAKTISRCFLASDEPVRHALISFADQLLALPFTSHKVREISRRKLKIQLI